jgi:DNA-binding CsgD family transcriptional regulator/N-acetylneuraminic acid mutarotase
MAERGEPLSDRELDVLNRLAAGETNKVIADELSISPLTVKTHLRNIYAKLGVSTRTEAMTVAIQQGMVSLTADDGRQAADSGQWSVVSGELSVDSGQLSGDRSRLKVSGQPSAADAQTDGGATSHRWRAVSLALLALLLLVVALFAYFQMRDDSLLATSAEPFVDQPVGDTRWSISRPMPEPSAGRAVAAVGLDVYVIGGETETGITDEVRVFETQARAWRRATAKPTAVGETTADVLFGEIYVPGGLTADGQPTDVVEAYSPSQDAWRLIASLPQPVAGGLAIAEGGFLYFFGGRNETGALDTAYVYDPGGDSWRPIAPLPQPRFGVTGGALTGRLYVVGGSDGVSAQASCFVYDPAADAWEDCPPMLRPRAGAGATVLLNKLYVIGGMGEATDPAAWHGEVFDPNSRAWTVLNVPPDVTAWTEPSVTHVETRIYALGGRREEALSDESLVYAPLPFQTFIPAAPSDSEE